MYLNLIDSTENSQFTKYVIEIKDEDKVWQISKRYSDIRKLNKKLINNKICKISFPKRKMIHSVKNKEKRYVVLRNFFNSLSDIDRLDNNIFVHEFINSDICLHFKNDLYDETIIKNKHKIIIQQKNKTIDISDNLLGLKEQVNAQLGYIDILLDNINANNEIRDNLTKMIDIYLGNKKKKREEYEIIEQQLLRLDDKYQELSLQHRLRKAGIQHNKEQLQYYLGKCSELDKYLETIHHFFSKYETEFKDIEYKYQKYQEINSLIKNKININLEELRWNNFNSV